MEGVLTEQFIPGVEMGACYQDEDRWLACIKDAEDGATAIDICTASSLGDEEIVIKELGRNAGLALHRNNLGWNPLMFAVWNGHASLTQLLVQAARQFGQDPMHPAAGRLPRSGRTLLMVAARFAHPPIVKLLCTPDSLEAKDFRGQTALFHAVRGASEDIVRFLIAQGANINASDSKGQTVLWVAVRFRLTALEHMLREAGAILEAHQQQRSPSAAVLDTEDELAHVLKGLSLEKYLPLFKRNHIDLESFLTLDEENLRHIGVSLLGPRRKMAIEITRLRTLLGLSDDLV